MKEVSIVLTRYDEPNYLVKKCLVSLSKQKDILATVIFLDQIQDVDLNNFCEKIKNKNINIIYKNIPKISLNYARNLGLKMSNTNIVLFLDSDAIPDQYWSSKLVKTYKLNEKIAIVGGQIKALWLNKPKWFSKSQKALTFYSSLKYEKDVGPVKHVFGVNFSIHKRRLLEESYFNEDLDRRKGILLSGGETDLCDRAIKKDLLVYYNDSALVYHQILPKRNSIFWLIKRTYWGGFSKGYLKSTPNPISKKNNFQDLLFIAFIILPYFFGFLLGRFKKDEK